MTSKTESYFLKKIISFGYLPWYKINFISP